MPVNLDSPYLRAKFAKTQGVHEERENRMDQAYHQDRPNAEAPKRGGSVVDINTAAHVLGMNADTLRKRCKANKDCPPFTKKGRRYEFVLAQLLDWRDKGSEEETHAE